MHTHARIVRTDAHIHIVTILYEYDNDDINEKVRPIIIDSIITSCNYLYYRQNIHNRILCMCLRCVSFSVYSVCLRTHGKLATVYVLNRLFLLCTHVFTVSTYTKISVSNHTHTQIK